MFYAEWPVFFVGFSFCFNIVQWISLQLNTPQALEAASRAGELNDQMIAQSANSDDVSLAAQEGLEIRGKKILILVGIIA